ncbi:MAG TPA: hypothetical protein VF861_10325 [Telluria sp.]
MTTAYHLIQLTQAAPGMVLSDLLLDRQGQMLLPKGAVLTESMLASLARHGVEMVPVLAAAAAQAPPDQSALQARLDHVFRRHQRGNDDDWATGILRQYVEDYRLERGVAQ